MEEKELLRILMLIYCTLIANTILAEESDLEWAKGVAEREAEMIMDNFKNSMGDEGFDQDLRESILRPRPSLQIFVSSSMPQALLKNYAKEAHRYSGVLVFCGLPSGSFHKITELVMNISDENYPVAAQIDDEAFREFDIKTVPTIVLSKPTIMFLEQTTQGQFDKISGNITIKAALEIFASQGDLARNARELLK